jgi:hypothetical protein
MSDSQMAPLYADLPPARAAADRRWAVEFGRFDREAGAMAVLSALALEEVAVLEPAAVRIATAGSGGSKTWKITFDGYDAESARKTCAALARLDEPCRTVRPGG